MATTMTPARFRNYARFAIENARYGDLAAAEEWLAMAKRHGATADACRDTMYFCRQLADQFAQRMAFQRYAIAESVWRLRVAA